MTPEEIAEQGFAFAVYSFVIDRFNHQFGGNWDALVIATDGHRVLGGCALTDDAIRQLVDKYINSPVKIDRRVIAEEARRQAPGKRS